MDVRSHTKKMAQARRKARGVAMVEGALIFPIMSFFLVYLELAHHSYDGYITAEHVARERAWSSALQGSVIGGCDSGARDDQSYKPSYFSISAGGSGTDGKGTSPNVPNGDKIASIPGGDQSRFIIKKHFAIATADVNVARGGVSYNHKPSSKTAVYCNQPWIGGLTDIIKKIFHLGGGTP